MIIDKIAPNVIIPNFVLEDRENIYRGWLGDGGYMIEQADGFSSLKY